MFIFKKNNGNILVLPHYFAKHIGGDILLNEEYSEHKWVSVEGLESFEPKIPDIPRAVKQLLKIRKVMDDSEFVEL